MEHALRQSSNGDSTFLSTLMDCLGVCSLSPLDLISKVRTCAQMSLFLVGY